MKPISVKLLNFRQHAESFVEFKNGLTVIAIVKERLQREGFI